MINNPGLNKTLYITTGALALAAGLTGIIDPGMYTRVAGSLLLPGMFSQDLVVTVTAVVMIVLAIWMRKDDYRKLIVILGILGFFFYAYGIYSIEQIYTSLYPLYLAILALSFYTIIFSMSSLKITAFKDLELTPVLRYTASGYAIFISLLFNFIWISQLVPLLRTGDRIEYTFSVYIIDLVFIMPAFALAALLALRKRSSGIIGLPALFILGAGILSPLAIAELLKPHYYGIEADPGGLILYSTLSIVFLALSALYLALLRPPGHGKDRSDPS